MEQEATAAVVAIVNVAGTAGIREAEAGASVGERTLHMHVNNMFVVCRRFT